MKGIVTIYTKNHEHTHVRVCHYLPHTDLNTGCHGLTCTSDF